MRRPPTANPRSRWRTIRAPFDGLWHGAVASPVAAASLATALAAVLSSLVAAAALHYTAVQSKATADQVAQTEEGQVTDRYIRTVTQLSDSHVEVRVGSIYALARLARDSPRDQISIVEVLNTYIRNHVTLSRNPTCTGSPDQNPQPDAAAVRAAGIVISNRDRTRDSLIVDYRDLCLRGLSFTGENLTDFFLDGADLSYSSLDRSNLKGVHIAFANVSHAELIDSDLTDTELAVSDFVDTDLHSSNLTHANLSFSQLPGADFAGANLSGANLSYANMCRADLTGADLTGADVTGTNLSAAVGANLRGTVTKYVSPPPPC